MRLGLADGSGKTQHHRIPKQILTNFTVSTSHNTKPNRAPGFYHLPDDVFSNPRPLAALSQILAERPAAFWQIFLTLVRLVFVVGRRVLWMSRHPPMDLTDVCSIQ